MSGRLFLRCPGVRVPGSGDPSRASLKRRWLLGIGAVVLALGPIGPAPASAAPDFASTPTSAAKATTKPTISGTVREDAPGTWPIGAQKYQGRPSGKLEIYTSGCVRVTRARVTWKGTRFTVSKLKAGRYRILYRDLTARTSSLAPYGLSSGTWFGGGPECRSSAVIRLRSGKKVTGKTLTVHARVGLQSVGAGLQKTSDHVDRYRVYAAKSGVHVADIASDDDIRMLAPGSYRVAVVRTATASGKTAVLRVFGAPGAIVSRGRIVTVPAARVLQLDFGAGTSRSFPVPGISALVGQTVTTADGAPLLDQGTDGTRLSGARVGDVLRAVPAETHSRASSVVFHWKLARASADIATGATLPLAATYAGKTLSVTGVYARSGYLSRALTTTVQVEGSEVETSPPLLVLKDPQTLEGDLSPAPAGADYDYVTHGSGLVSLDAQATFVDAQQQPLQTNDPPACVWSYVDGYPPDPVIRSGTCTLGSNYLSAAVGHVVRFTVTYSRDGYQDFTVTTTLLVEDG